MGTLTGLFGYSRQSYYLPHKDNDFSENALEPLIVEKAREYRKSNPGLGCAKLYIIIKKMFEETGCMPGRDAFTDLLRRNGFAIDKPTAHGLLKKTAGLFDKLYEAMRQAVKEDKYLKCGETYHKILVKADDNDGLPPALQAGLRGHDRQS